MLNFDGKKMQINKIYHCQFIIHYQHLFFDKQKCVLNDKINFFLMECVFVANKINYFLCYNICNKNANKLNTKLQYF